MSDVPEPYSVSGQLARLGPMGDWGDWLYDSDGNVRRELFTQNDAEIDAKAAEIDAAPALGPTFRHEVYVDPAKWAITQGTSGWMELVRVDLRAQTPFFLCRGDRGGGFVGIDMITEWRSFPRAYEECEGKK